MYEQDYDPNNPYVNNYRTRLVVRCALCNDRVYQLIDADTSGEVILNIETIHTIYELTPEDPRRAYPHYQIEERPVFINHKLTCKGRS